jgi:hypothetical protein
MRPRAIPCNQDPQKKKEVIIAMLSFYVFIEGEYIRGEIVQRRAIPCNLMRPGAIPCNLMRPGAIPSNPVQPRSPKEHSSPYLNMPFSP